jgi:hypothetical protein
LLKALAGLSQSTAAAQHLEHMHVTLVQYAAPAGWLQGCLYCSHSWQECTGYITLDPEYKLHLDVFAAPRVLEGVLFSNTNACPAVAHMCHAGKSP